MSSFFWFITSRSKQLQTWLGTSTANPTGPGSQLILAKFYSASPTDAQQEMTALQSKHSIKFIDIVSPMRALVLPRTTCPAHNVSVDAFCEHIQANGLELIYLYQIVHPLLKKGQRKMFVGVKSPLGSTGGWRRDCIRVRVYRPSKAVLPWIMRKVHFEGESEEVGRFPQTNMGNESARNIGLERAFQMLEESVNGIARIIDGATREAVGGQLRVWDRSLFPR
ncbi:hypothetical protein BDW71DRAFT_195460 [Aspergillus fruticulosus]